LENTSVILRLEKISKAFPGIQALDQVDLEIYRGSVHALVGENGAGKSTLIKIICGALQKDTGEIYFENRSVDFGGPNDAEEEGIATVHQEHTLIPVLTAAENIFLNREPLRWANTVVDWRTLRCESEDILQMVGLHIDPFTKVENLSPGQQQMIALAKALFRNPKLLIFDEPTASLTEDQMETLFGLIRTAKSKGAAVMYISHRMEEIFSISDYVTVLRDGKHIATKLATEIKEDALAKLMVGHELEKSTPDGIGAKKEVLLEIRNLSRRNEFNKVSFALRRGEILGLAGLVGSRRTELLESVFGARAADEGEIYVNGRIVSIQNPWDAIEKGIVLLPEDRKYLGLILSMKIRENISFTILDRIRAWLLFIRFKKEIDIANKYVKSLDIRAYSVDQNVDTLSGGNQQKVLLSRLLATNANIFLLDEPTRGVDVGAKQELHNIIRKLAESGNGILYVSSDIHEMLPLCQRILVIHEGRIIKEFDYADVTKEKIIATIISSGINAM
jgi:ABC-type sugar transport system ATPase subunit